MSKGKDKVRRRSTDDIVRDIRTLHARVGDELGRLSLGIYSEDLRPEAKKLLRFARELDASMSHQTEAA